MPSPACCFILVEIQYRYCLICNASQMRENKMNAYHSFITSPGCSSGTERMRTICSAGHPKTNGEAPNVSGNFPLGYVIPDIQQIPVSSHLMRQNTIHLPEVPNYPRTWPLMNTRLFMQIIPTTTNNLHPEVLFL